MVKPLRAGVADLSDTGARVRGASALPVGSRRTLEIDGVAPRSPFSVEAWENDLPHLVFAIDEATAAEFRGTAVRLAWRQAV